MENWRIDVPVLCIFFARPDQFKEVFECVRQARPRVLLLWQDGPRENRQDDIENIKKCREIAENIDWECKVYRNYHKKNMGCDPSTHLSHKWAFTIVDKCIILEDDIVVSQSFFRFCKEMLDKYEDDIRVDRICGINLLGEYDIPYDYFFSDTGNSWGWATWKRVADKWETTYDFVDDKYTMECINNILPKFDKMAKWEYNCKLRKKQGVPYWEYIVSAETMLNNGLVIYPRVNMVKNIGFTKNATHAPSDISMMSRRSRIPFFAKIYELTFPLKEPKYFIKDAKFQDKVTLRLKGNRLQKIIEFPERIFYKIKRFFYSKFK